MEESRQLMPRLMRTAALEPRAFDEIEADREATTQAAVVVVLASLCAGLGTMLAGGGWPGFLVGIVASLVAWLVWSWFAYATGVTLFHGTADYGELLRTIGFAHGPLLLRVLRFVPLFGGLIWWLAGIWSLIAGVVAVRQALDFNTERALGTVIVGWMIQQAIFAALEFFTLGFWPNIIH